MSVWLESQWGVLESDSVTTRRGLRDCQVQYSHFTAGEREVPREEATCLRSHSQTSPENQLICLSTYPDTETFPCSLRNPQCNLNNRRCVCPKQCCTGTCLTTTFLGGKKPWTNPKCGICQFLLLWPFQAAEGMSLNVASGVMGRSHH